MTDRADGSKTPISRRKLITGAAVAAGGALLANVPAAAQQKTAAPALVPPPTAPVDPTKFPGAPATAGRIAIAVRKSSAGPRRRDHWLIAHTAPGSYRNHHSGRTCTSTRIHAGIPTIDPAKHTLMIPPAGSSITQWNSPLRS